jgi:hypothetical protein
MVERGPKSQMANLLVVLDVGRGGEARAPPEGLRCR